MRYTKYEGPTVGPVVPYEYLRGPAVPHEYLRGPPVGPMVPCEYLILLVPLGPRMGPLNSCHVIHVGPE